MSAKYKCTTCRNEFNHPPFHLGREGIFCRNICYEQYKDDHGLGEPKQINGSTYRGNHIKRH